MWSRLLCLSAAALQGLASASSDTFLAKEQQVDLLSRLEGVLGTDHRQTTEARVAKITGKIETTFASLPKSGRGSLGAPAARYAIHRYFIQQHGWAIKGLAPAGQAWSSSSPVESLGDRMPEEVHGVFHEHLSNHGFNLHEVAVLAATLENLIHAEASGRLRSTYAALGESTEGTLSAEQAMEVLDTFLQSFLLSYNISEMSTWQVARMRKVIDSLFPYWQDAKAWLREVQQDVAPELATMAFSDAVQIAEAVSERYGRQADKDCDDIQDKLLKLEEGDTGRVKLRDFYISIRSHGFWNFRESLEYLRYAGAIDESDSSVPRVIIPNYLQLPSNCVANSNYFSVCCMDRCESMMAHVEREIQAPQATTERILGIVASLPSASVHAKRIPAGLVRKLEEVAAHHGGVVPLHGRLFAQWMHFAYPRECVYPHISNTTAGMGEDEWERATALNSSLSKPQAALFAETIAEATYAEPRTSEDGETFMSMWVPEEELVDAVEWKASREAQQWQQQAFSTAKSALGIAALLALVGSTAAAIRDFVSQAADAAQGDGASPLAKSKHQKVVLI